MTESDAERFLLVVQDAIDEVLAEASRFPDDQREWKNVVAIVGSWIKPELLRRLDFRPFATFHDTASSQALELAERFCASQCHWSREQPAGDHERCATCVLYHVTAGRVEQECEAAGLRGEI